MKRAALVLVGTAAGVTAVVSYHATASSSAPGIPASPASTSQRSASGSTVRSPARSTATGGRTSATAPATAHRPAGRSAPRAAVGAAVPFPYGRLQVKVTERDGRISDVSVVSLQLASPRSQSIAATALPELRDEVLSAQSARIDGVSGASYTSSAYERSVQSALDRLA